MNFEPIKQCLSVAVPEPSRLTRGLPIPELQPVVTLGEVLSCSSARTPKGDCF